MDLKARESRSLLWNPKNLIDRVLTLFDEEFYKKQVPGLTESGEELFQHYLMEGWKLSLDPHPLFSTTYYLEQRPNCLKAQINPLVDYIGSCFETKNIDPHPLFSTSFYSSLEAIGEQTALEHFILNDGGVSSCHPLFDLDFYRMQCATRLSRPFLKKHSSANLLMHFILEGEKIGLNPHPLFDVTAYHWQRNDVQKNGMNSLIHYITFGHLEGAWPHPLFDIEFYKTLVPTKTISGKNALENFLHRSNSKCSTHILFDVEYYIAQVRSRHLVCQEHPILHYLRTGYTLGLNPHPLFDSDFYSKSNLDFDPTTRDTLSHYLVWGWQCRAHPHPMFDTSWYLERYQSQYGFDGCPLQHYVANWRDHPDLDPCFGFDSSEYLRLRPACLSANVLPPYHYYAYSRLSYDVPGETLSLPGDPFQFIKQNLRETPRFSKDVVPVRMFFASHDASLTGAPRIALNVVKELAKNCLDVIVFLKCGGPRVADFKQHASVIDLEALTTQYRITNFALLVMELELPGQTVATINSFGSLSLGLLFSYLKVPTVALIHEFIRMYPKSQVNKLLDSVKGVVFPAEIVRNDAIKHFPERTELVQKSIVLRQGVWDEALLPTNKASHRDSIRKKLSIHSDTFLVLACGTIDMRKGADLFVQIGLEYKRQNPEKDVVFVWVGGNPDPNLSIHNWVNIDITNQELDYNIRFVGEFEDPSEYFQAADVFLLTSRVDPFPCVVLEALAASLPVVAFDRAGGATEVVLDDAGTIVRYLDIAAAVSALDAFIRQPWKRASAGKAGRARIDKEYRFGPYVQKVVTFISKMTRIRYLGKFSTPIVPQNRESQSVSRTSTLSAYMLLGENELLTGGIDLLATMKAELETQNISLSVISTNRRALPPRIQSIFDDSILISTRRSASKEEQAGALYSFLQQHEPCILLTSSACLPAELLQILPLTVAVVGLVEAYGNSEIDFGYISGRYLRKIVYRYESFAENLLSLNPIMKEKLSLCPAVPILLRDQILKTMTTELKYQSRIVFWLNSDVIAQECELAVLTIEKLCNFGFRTEVTFVTSSAGTQIHGEIRSRIEAMGSPTILVKTLGISTLQEERTLFAQTDVVVLSATTNDLVLRATEAVSLNCLPVVFVDPRISPHQISARILDKVGMVTILADSADGTAEELARYLERCFHHENYRRRLVEISTEILSKHYPIEQAVQHCVSIVKEVAQHIDSIGQQGKNWAPVSKYLGSCSEFISEPLSAPQPKLAQH